MRSMVLRFGWLPLLVLMLAAMWTGLLTSGAASSAAFTTAMVAALCLMALLAYRTFRNQRAFNAAPGLLAARPFAAGAEAAAQHCGLDPARLAEVASGWALPPMVDSGRLRDDAVLGCWFGDRNERQVIVAVAHDGRTAGDAEAFLLTVAALIDGPADTMAWMVAAPADADPSAAGLRPPATWHEVPVPVQPERWRALAGNPRYAWMLMNEVADLMAGPPHVWRIDGFDVVRVDTFPLDAPAVTPEGLERLLDEVCATAEAAERLIRTGYADRPFTPAWPEGSTVTERFPEDVRAALVKAGWTEGRSVPVSTQEWLASLPVAEAALAEFGGLTIEYQAPTPNHQGGSFTLDPARVAQIVAQLNPWNGHRISPLGQVDGLALGAPLLLTMTENGLVIGLRPDDDLLLGHSFDEALIKLTRGLFAPAVGNRGSLRRPA